jgi:membrane-associated protease RseP (regulator of RpoE activity)
VGFWIAALVMIAGLAASGRAAQAQAQRTDDVPWLGVITQEITDELREGMNLADKGVLVARVLAGSPADRAGIRKGDVIASVNSRAVSAPDELQRIVRGGKVGQAVSIALLRDGQSRTITAKLEARREPADSAPESRRVIIRKDKDGDENEDRGEAGDGPEEFELNLPDLEHLPMMAMAGRGRLGVRVEPMNPDLAEYFKVPGGKGALVLQVMDDTPAAKAGVKSGDVIVKVGSKSVTGSDDLVAALREEGRHTTLTVMRRGATRTIETDLNEAPRGMHWQGDLEGMGPGGPGDARRIVIRRHMAPGAEKRIVIRSGDGPEGDDMKQELRDLKKEIEELREKLESLEKR